ncbi:MAG: hypothetical protein ACPGRD_07840, partial [Planktomarina sp.]
RCLGWHWSPLSPERKSLAGFASVTGDRGSGGTARPGHLIAVTAWADIFSTALSILVMLIGIITPIFGGMLVFAVTIVMVRVSILFLKEVHGFEGIGRAVAVFFLSILVSSFILSNIALMTGFLRIEIVA